VPSFQVLPGAVTSDVTRTLTPLNTVSPGVSITPS
jgi:hypothetical protein